MPLSLLELMEAQALSSLGKSPVADGLPAEVYRRYAETLMPQLRELFLDALERVSLLPSMNEVVIMLLLKLGKDAH